MTPRLHRGVLFKGCAVLAAAGVGALVLWLSGLPINVIVTEPAHLRAWLLALGPFAPLGVILLQVLQIVIAPIPGQAIGMMSGYLYGFWGGIAISMLGGLAGSACALLLARKFGRPVVLRFANTKAVSFAQKFDRIQSPLVWAVVFALPIGDPLIFAAGLTNVAIPRLLLGALLGRLPGQLLACYFGAESASIGVIAWVIAFAIGGIGSLLLLRFGDRIERRTLRLAKRPEPELG